MDEFLAEIEARMAEATRADGARAPLTAEAMQVIAAADQGGTPMFTSAILARIAKENGVDVSADMTPNDIIADNLETTTAYRVATDRFCDRLADLAERTMAQCTAAQYCSERVVYQAQAGRGA